MRGKKGSFRPQCEFGALSSISKRKVLYNTVKPVLFWRIIFRKNLGGVSLEALNRYLMFMTYWDAY